MYKAVLTEREKDILALKLDGLIDKEVAKRLAISYSTVRTHINRARLKCGCESTLQLILQANDLLNIA